MIVLLNAMYVVMVMNISYYNHNICHVFDRCI